MSAHIWSIVLAAGAGRRLSALTGGVPKQFFRPSGRHSLLEITLARVRALSPASRTIVIVDESHRAMLAACHSVDGAQVLYQPMDRGTAAGVLMALTPVLTEDPDGIVVLTPSDHGVQDDASFSRGVAHAAELAQRGNAVTLFGVQPTHAFADYGWIVPHAGSGAVRRVSAFVEKPAPELASDLMSRGGVWNTMVVVGRASAIWALFEEHLTELTTVFDTAREFDSATRQRFLRDVYPGLPRRDFSRDLLEHARSLYVYTFPKALGWSDLGTPERLSRWMTAGAA